MKRTRKRRAWLVSMIGIAAISYAVSMPHNVCALSRTQAEAVLRQHLDTLRKTIDAYTYDKRKAPQSLEDLVTAGYLRKIPRDPITCQPDWEVVIEDTMASVDQTEPGINDVHSASQLQSTEGTAYNTW